jgi:hypothetical protein
MALVDLLKPVDAPLTSCVLRLAPQRIRDRIVRCLRRGLLVAHAPVHGLNNRRLGPQVRCRFGSSEGRTKHHRLPFEQTLDSWRSAGCQ